jgi:hypothetical protein
MGLLDTEYGTVNAKKPRNSDRIQQGVPMNYRGLLEAAQNIPIAGDALSGGMAMYDAVKGDYGSAALNALGVLPFMSAGMVKKAKQTVSIPAHDDFFKAIGVDKKKVMADVDKLQRKHPEHFNSPDDVESHLQYVFGSAPNASMSATDPRFTLLARDADQMPVATGEAYRTAVADLSGKKNNNYWVRSAYPMSEDQLALKLAGGRGAVPVSEVSSLAHLSGAKPAHAEASVLPEVNITPQRQPMQYELAHETARKNAVEMLGLPENNTAMDRAMAMNMEDGWYHATNYPEQLDNIRTGKGTLGDVSYLTSAPEKADFYPKMHNMARKREGLEELPVSVYPVMVNKGNNLKLNELPATKVNASNVASNGFDSISYNNELGVINPANIRSRFAAFDPARRHEADLLGNATPEFLSVLAGGGLLGLGGYSLMGDK